MMKSYFQNIVNALKVCNILKQSTIRLFLFLEQLSVRAQLLQFKTFSNINLFK